jgi:SAM-dependent methyltransferase
MLKIMQNIHSLAIGGGPKFQADGWYNLEEVIGEQNTESFTLSPDCVFPFTGGDIQRIYSSHCLEHLNIPTVVRVLSECFRVLVNDGELIIKLPDFEMVLQRWKDCDEEFFNVKRWGFDAVIPTWKSRGVVDCLDYRAAMVFCGFWNAEYGDHFSGKVKDDSDAYHGPPVVSRDRLAKLRDRCTPSEISRKLREMVLENEGLVKFNHQSAWSRFEFCNVLEVVGFAVAEGDSEVIINKYADIPQIAAMDDFSMYFVAKKQNNLLSV